MVLFLLILFNYLKIMIIIFILFHIFYPILFTFIIFIHYLIFLQYTSFIIPYFLLNLIIFFSLLIHMQDLNLSTITINIISHLITNHNLKIQNDLVHILFKEYSIYFLLLFSLTVIHIFILYSNFIISNN